MKAETQFGDMLHSLTALGKTVCHRNSTFVVRSSMRLALDRLLSIDACLFASAAANLACRGYSTEV